MDFMSVFVVLAALVALASPIWVRYVVDKSDTEVYTDRLADTVNFIQREQNPYVLEQLMILSECRRMLLHVELMEGLERLDQGHS